MAEKGLLDRCREFVREQSCGEWDNDTINEDAAKLRTFILQEVNTYPAVEGLVKALEASRLKHLSDGLWESHETIAMIDTALSRFRSLQNGSEA